MQGLAFIRLHGDTSCLGRTEPAAWAAAHTWPAIWPAAQPTPEALAPEARRFRAPQGRWRGTHAPLTAVQRGCGAGPRQAARTPPRPGAPSCTSSQRCGAAPAPPPHRPGAAHRAGMRSGVHSGVHARCSLHGPAMSLSLTPPSDRLLALCRQPPRSRCWSWRRAAARPQSCRSTWPASSAQQSAAAAAAAAAQLAVTARRQAGAGRAACCAAGPARMTASRGAPPLLRQPSTGLAQHNASPGMGQLGLGPGVNEADQQAGALLLQQVRVQGLGFSLQHP